MKALLISALAATLTGCACFQTSINGCMATTGQACPDPSVAKPAAFEFATPKAKSTISANVQNSPSNQLGKRTHPVTMEPKNDTVGEMKPLPSAQLSRKADPTIEKAKATIAAMIDDPGSAEFGEMTRAVKTLLGEPIDVICGYVKGKNKSGADTGEMPFVYVIAHNEAYLADGSSPMADTVHRNLCDQER